MKILQGSEGLGQVLPFTSILPVDRLTAVFRNTTNAYKFYWFRAILSVLKEGGGPEISQQELTRRMFEQVWYPIDFFKLSFGRQDGFAAIVRHIREHAPVNALDNSPAARPIAQQVAAALKGDPLKRFEAQLLSLYQYVPYRFVRPFVEKEVAGLKDAQVDLAIRAAVNEVSKQDPARCPYHFTDTGICINAGWLEYFRTHLAILEGFVNWNLVQFLQVRNPNISGIATKLFKPEERQLAGVRQAWNVYREQKGRLECIYSGKVLAPNFSLDHFIPWSFVAHDLNWNLAPISKEINSSKSDRLPDSVYLQRMIALQFDFLHSVAGARGVGRVLEDYALLFHKELTDIKQLPFERFAQTFSDTFHPMLQIAKNAGFSDGWKYEKA
ncbi:MAG: hypothetical protein EOO16_16385 [Chitinophagaceae bacterium]|nr:MAG: hypothetical protein EOO16_16385 [Chitinophagaceae bacterium]